jgi:hypothetical protein
MGFSHICTLCPSHISYRKSLKQMKRWEGWTVAIATMFTASSSGSLRRIRAQFARLLSPRPEFQNRCMLSVCLGGFHCHVQSVIYCCINTASIHLHLQIEMPYCGHLSSNLWGALNNPLWRRNFKYEDSHLPPFHDEFIRCPIYQLCRLFFPSFCTCL